MNSTRSAFPTRRSVCDTGNPACPTQTLMWLGYITYPDTFLLPEDKTTLRASRFIAATPEPVPEPATGMLLISGFAGVALARIRRATGTP